MITPEKIPARRRLQVLDDQLRLDAIAMHESCEKEDRWVANFITDLAGVIGNIVCRK
jgi:hypothetical protein